MAHALRRFRMWLMINSRGRRARQTSPGSRPAAIKVCITLLIIAAVLFITLNIVLIRIKPVLSALAKAEAREYVVLAINEAVEQEILSGSLSYSEFVSFEKDSNGGITALVTDMARINLLQSRISNLAATNVVNILSTDMSVPLGDALGGVFFSMKWPRIPVRMESVTDVKTQFINDFESAGINQTRHRLSLTITADIVVLFPGGQTTAVVESTVTIAETVIVGNVPNIYTN